MVEGFLVGLAMGIIIGLAIARLRPTGYASPPGPNAIPTASSKAANLPASGSIEIGHLPGLRIRGQVVTHRLETRLTPEGVTIVADGQEYHHLADVPDHLLADQARASLRELAASLTNPTERAALEKEMLAAGIEPADPA
jgi:hypothetical protein